MAVTTNWTPTGDWLQCLSQDELDSLTVMHDWRSWASVALDWALVAAAMTLVAYRPGIVSIVVALFVIGARQLGLSILMHEAAHLTLFKN
ncbi:MAG: fatty acid desaturase, partial [Deltaproteobacteria bacterium]